VVVNNSLCIFDEFIEMSVIGSHVSEAKTKEEGSPNGMEWNGRVGGAEETDLFPPPTPTTSPAARPIWLRTIPSCYQYHF